MSSSPAVPRLQLLATAVLFSTGGAAIKAADLSMWQIASFRSGVAVVALWLVLPGTRRGWNRRILLVGAAYAATMILYVTGNKLTTAANAIFLQSTAPLYLLMMGPVLLSEPVRRRDLTFGLALAAGMLLFFVGVQAPLETAPDPLLGNIVGAGAGLTWALTIFGLRWLGRGGKNPSAAAASVVAGNLIAFLVCLPLALPVARSEPADWAIVAYLGVFQIGLAYVLMTRAVRRLPALEVSLLLLLEPVLNSVWAWLVHDERPGSWSLLGCAVILVATAVHVLRRR